MIKCQYCTKEIDTLAEKCRHCGMLLSAQNKKSLLMSTQKQHLASNRNKRIGIFWLIGPTLFLVVILIIYAIASFIFRDGLEDSFTHQLFNVILGSLGIICVLLMIVGIFIGIIYLNKKDYISAEFDSRSGKGKLSEMPTEIKGWSWAAFSFSWIWGLVHNVYLSLLIFIPYFGLIWMVVLGIKGKKWAWQAKSWPSVEEFIRVQKKWDFWGKIFFGFQILSIIVTFTIVALTVSEDEYVSPFYKGYEVGYQDAASSTFFCAGCDFPEPVADYQQGYYYGYYDACFFEDLGCETNLPPEILEEIESSYQTESDVG